jgi:flavin reductase (DIM6/NTAB) family NADH-FMN oxidoreductase RutF
MHEAISAAQSFGVSILSAEQREVARYFADWRRPRGKAQFDSMDCVDGPLTGSPLLTGCLAWLECKLVSVYEGGDHSIFLGEVLHSSRGSSPQALLFYGGGYHELGAPVRATA